MVVLIWPGDLMLSDPVLLIDSTEYLLFFKTYFLTILTVFKSSLVLQVCKPKLISECSVAVQHVLSPFKKKVLNSQD